MSNEPTVTPTHRDQAVPIRRRVERAMREAIHDLRSDARMVGLPDRTIREEVVRAVARWACAELPGEFWSTVERGVPIITEETATELAREGDELRRECRQRVKAMRVTDLCSCGRPVAYDSGLCLRCAMPDYTKDGPPTFTPDDEGRCVHCGGTKHSHGKATLVCPVQRTP